MIRVALKGLAARPVRTALTTLAIVVGVAFVCAAYTLTDTMSGAADSLTHAAYDGTDAVVVTKTAFRGSQTVRHPRAGADDPGRRRWSGSAPRRGVDTAVGDITDTAQVIGTDGKPVGTGPYFGVGFDAHDAGRRAPDPVPPPRRPLGRRPGRGRDRPRHGRVPGLRRRRRDPRRRPRRGAARSRSPASPRSPTSSRSARPARRSSTSRPRARCSPRTATTASSSPAHAPTRSTPRSGHRGPHAPPTTTASRSTRSRRSWASCARSCSPSPAWRCSSASFTIFNSLSITVAQRTKEFGLLRMVGATRRQVRAGVLLEALTIGLLASGAGHRRRRRRSPPGCRRSSPRSAWSCPPTGSRSPPARSSSRCSSARWPRCSRPRSRPGARPRSRRWPRCATPPRRSSRACSPAACAAWRASSAARRPRSAAPPARLARRNAMRNPGRTAVTASALMIGVALVTAVTVVAQGLEDQSRGALERHVQASDDRHRRRRLVADRPRRSSRRSPASAPSAACARTARSSSATRRASTASIPATIGGSTATTSRPATLDGRRRDRRRRLRDRARRCSVGSPLDGHLDEGHAS